MVTWRCPKCKQATSFHVSKTNNVLVLRCWYVNKCGWEKEITIEE